MYVHTMCINMLCLCSFIGLPNSCSPIHPRVQPGCLQFRIVFYALLVIFAAFPSVLKPLRMSQPGSSVGAGHQRKEPSRLGRRIGIFVGSNFVAKCGKTSKLIEESVELNVKDVFPKVFCFLLFLIGIQSIQRLP